MVLSHGVNTFIIGSVLSTGVVVSRSCGEEVSHGVSHGVVTWCGRRCDKDVVIVLGSVLSAGVIVSRGWSNQSKSQTQTPTIRYDQYRYATERFVGVEVLSELHETSVAKTEGRTRKTSPTLGHNPTPQ